MPGHCVTSQVRWFLSFPFTLPSCSIKVAFASRLAQHHSAAMASDAPDATAAGPVSVKQETPPTESGGAVTEVANADLAQFLYVVERNLNDPGFKK